MKIDSPTLTALTRRLEKARLKNEQLERENKRLKKRVKELEAMMEFIKDA